MPTGMIGANTAELREIAGRFAQRAMRVDDARAATMTAINRLEWVGEDRDRFVENWATRINSGLGTLHERLSEIGGIDLPAQADAQDDASAANGSGGGGGSGGERGFGFLSDWRDRWRIERTDVDDDERHVDGHRRLTDEQSIDPYDINQNAVGSCWLLAPLAAQAGLDPGFLADNIVYDESTNEYIVTLYEDGEPVEVRVESSYFIGRDGEYMGVVDDDGNPNYASIYEKAVAEHLGGKYGDVDGGYADEGIELITGKEAVSHAVDSPGASPEAIAAQLEAGEPVVASTKMLMGPNSPIVSGHVYTVTDVTPQGDLVLYNPWGANPESDTYSGTDEPGEIVIPAEDVHKYFSSVETTAG